MNFIVQRKPLQDALSRAMAVIGKSSSNPILESVLIEASPEAIAITGSDHSIRVTAKVPPGEFSVACQGSVLLPADKLMAMVRSNDSDSMTFDVKGETVTVKAGVNAYRLPTADWHAYPGSRQATREPVCEVLAVNLVEAIKRTTLSCEIEGSKLNSGGILLDANEGSLYLVGIDGRQMSYQLITPRGTLHGASAIVPEKALKVASRVFASNATGEVRISLDSGTIAFEDKSSTLVSGLVGGRFAPWRKLMKFANEPKKITIFPREFEAAIRQLSFLTKESYAKLQFTFLADRVEIQTTTDVIGDGKASAMAEYAGDEPVTVVLDGMSLLGFLRALNSSAPITCEIDDPEMATMFTSNDGFRYILMPFQTESA